MQYRNPKNPPSHPSTLDQAFARALRRVAAEPDPDPDPDPDPEPAGGGAQFLPDTDADEGGADALLVDGAQLLRAVREPVEWLLGLARRLAADDPVDVAAVARIHAAFHARLRGRPASLRSSDLFIVLGLLLGALDPSVVVRAVADTVGEGLAAFLGSESPVEIEIAETVGSTRQPSTRRLGFLRWCCPMHTRFVL